MAQECWLVAWLFLLYLPLELTGTITVTECTEGGRGLCLPKEYQKFDLPSPNKTTFVTIGINLKDIPKISDQDFSITIDTYFNVRWRDERLLSQMDPKTQDVGSSEGDLTAVNLNVLPNLWIPDIEILDLMSFETHKVLSRLEGVWIDSSGEVLYAMASKITFICQMNFNAFPVDIQVCHFRVGSFNYPYKKITFINEGIPHAEDIKSVLDYQVEFNPLPRDKSSYIALGMNYSAAGFEVVLTRKMSFYIITYYLPSGLFVVVSWISFLVNPEVVPGRMTMLVTLFLVLINIHNTIQTNSPKAEGFTAIKTWIIACIVFVFGALLEYSVILFLLKLEKIKSTYISMKGPNRCPQHAPPNQPTQESKALWPKGSIALEGNVSRRKGTANHRFTRLDVSFFVLFPILFIVFNGVYWSSVMHWRWGINADVLRIETN